MRLPSLSSTTKDALKKIALGVALLVIPGTGVVAGVYLLNKALKKKKA